MLTLLFSSRDSLCYSHLKRVEVKVMVLEFTLKENQNKVMGRGSAITGAGREFE